MLHKIFLKEINIPTTNSFSPSLPPIPGWNYKRGESIPTDPSVLSSSCPKGNCLFFLLLTIILKHLCYLRYSEEYEEKCQVNLVSWIGSSHCAEPSRLLWEDILPFCCHLWGSPCLMHLVLYTCYSSTEQQCTSVTSGQALCQKKNGSEQGNHGLCLRQAWSGWDGKSFISNSNLMIINMIKAVVVGGH